MVNADSEDREDAVRAQIATLQLELNLCLGDNRVRDNLQTEIARLEYWLCERNNPPSPPT